MNRPAKHVSWNSVLRKYHKLATQSLEGRSAYQIARVRHRLRLFEKRILRLHQQWSFGLSATALLCWLANPSLAQDTIDISSDPRVTSTIVATHLNQSRLHTVQTLDFNGDGEQDLLLPGGLWKPYYLIFGTGDSNLLAASSTTQLNGNNGFVINEGYKAVVVDINHDGMDDIVTHHNFATEPYVIFGTADPMPDTLFVADIDSADGFHITAPGSYALAANMVALEDFNGDGMQDLALFDYYREYYGDHYASYVLFGRQTGFDSIVNLEAMAPGEGLKIGADGLFWAHGMAAGDFNGDGATDIATGLRLPKQVEVLFGKPTGFTNDSIYWNTAVSSGTEGFTVDGNGYWPGVFGIDVAVPGDLNNDGYDELLFNADVDYYTATDSVSYLYALYGSNSFPGSIPLDSLVGGQGFMMKLIGPSPQISPAGDVNGDQLPDFMVSPGIFPITGTFLDPHSYVVYGSCTFPDSIGVADHVQASGGLILPGIRFYGTDAVGDFNDDGYDDLTFMRSLDTDSYIIVSESDLQLDAGAGNCVCVGTPIDIQGMASGPLTNFTWSSSGTGSFADSSLLGTTYQPSDHDAMIGYAMLTLQAEHTSGNCKTYSDELVLAVHPAPTVEAGPNDTICESDLAMLAGSGSGASNSYAWSTNGSGFFADAADPNTTYTPSSADGANGAVVLTLSNTNPQGVCATATDEMTLFLDAAAAVYAGEDTTICDTCTYTASGLISGGATSAVWTSDGTGSFDNANLLAATYTPSNQDVANGTVTLTLTSNDPSGPCVAVFDDLTLSFELFNSITSIQQSGIMQAYPNPARENQPINLGKSERNLRVYSMHGALIQAHQSATFITISEAGIYLLLSSEGATKIIVQ